MGQDRYEAMNKGEGAVINGLANKIVGLMAAVCRIASWWRLTAAGGARLVKGLTRKKDATDHLVYRLD